MSEPTSLWDDLKQRRVVRAVAIYAVVGWGAFEVTETAVPYLGAPDWLPRVALFALLLGFPLVAGLAWAFDVDRSGVQRAESSASRSRMWAAIAGAAVLAAGIGFFTLRSARTPSGTDILDPQRVAVSPFRASVGPDLAYLGEGMVDLLSVRLSEEDGLRAVDPSSMFAALGRRDAPPPRTELAQLARGLGAGRLISGGIVGDARQITITAELAEVGAPQAYSQEVTGSLDSLPVLVDRLVSRLLSRDAGEREDRIGSLAGSPPEAVRDYLRGRSLYRAGDYEAATDAFVGAIRADSTFALAGIALANAAGMTLTDPGGGQALGRRTAWRHRDRLPPDDREFLRYFLGRDYPDGRTHRQYLRDARDAETQFPNRIEAVYLNADALFHYGRPSGLENNMELSKRSFDRLLTLDPQHVVGIQHVLWIANERADTAAAVDAARRILELSSAPEALWQAALVAGIDSVSEAFESELADQSTEALISVVAFAGFPTPGGLLESDQGTVDEAVAILAGRNDVMPVAPEVFAMELNRGRLQSAQEWLGLMRRQGERPEMADRLELLAVVFGDLDATGAVAAAARLGSGLPPTPTVSDVRNACAVGLFELHSDEVTAARTVRDRLAGVDSDDPDVEREAEGCHLLLDAQLAVRSGAPGAVERVAALEGWTREGYGISPRLQSALPLATGRLYRSLGDLDGAQRALELCCAILPGHTTYVHTSRRELAEVAEARGDTATARQMYRLYRAAQESGDESGDESGPR